MTRSLDMPAIRIEGLSKKYLIGNTDRGNETFREMLMRKLSSPFRWLNNNYRERENSEFWALKDINLDISAGEVVGIIGKNGAGKSTLLKIISQITEPTAGRIKLRGRVSSLLEVGTGFHTELTGRENIFLNGAIMGMTRNEVREKFDEIVAFAEIEKFLDTPVKRYSSGMYVRLAFAVAAHLESDILIVDEVLAVGDAEFQKKCLGKMSEVGNKGRTVIFVSHNLNAIKNLCNTGILLNSGTLAYRGQIQDVIDLYMEESNSDDTNFPHKLDDLIIHDFNIYQKYVEIHNVDGDDSFDINFSFEVLKKLTQFRIGIYLKSPDGATILRTFLADWRPERENISPGKYHASLTLPSQFLAPGNYVILLHASRYGIKDYLSDKNIYRKITVSAPGKFNAVHMQEKFDSYIICDDRWQLSQVNNAHSVSK